MRLVARLLIGVALVLVLTGAALFLLRKPIAGAAVENLMAGARLKNPVVEIEDVNLSRLTLSRMEAGADPSAPDLSLGPVVFGYDWIDLIFRRKLKSVSIDSGRIVAALSESGAVSIAGWSPDPGAAPAPPPFGSLAVGNLDIIAAMPGGPAHFKVSGEFDAKKGGHFAVAADAAETGFKSAALTRLSGNGVVDLGADGSITIGGSLKGDLAAPAGVASDVDATFEGALSSWRGFFGDGPRELSGDATLALKSSTLDAFAPSLASLSAAGGAPIKALSVSGGLKATFAAGGYSVSATGGPLTIISDRGDRLVIEATNSALFESRDGAKRLALKAALDGPVANGAASVVAASENKAPWSIDASANFAEQAIGGVSLSSFGGTFRGAYQDNRATGVADIVTHVRKATIGRLTVSDMPAAARLAVDVDVAGKILTASPTGGQCLNTERAGFRFADQDMDARVTAASLCPAAAPLIAIGWGENAATHVEGALTARSAHYRLGKTVFDGAPPQVDFKLDYAPALQTSRIVGAIAGGEVVLNDALILTEARGEFDADLIRDTVAATVRLSSMRIAQNAELENVAPVMVAGRAQLAENVATFDFDVKTTQGARLGRGEGVHQVATGRGEAIFDSGLLKFSYGFQPDRLIPALRGVISNATGATEGRARFIWAPDEMASSATINLDNVSFGGRAVTRTEGVTGKLVFSGLSPISTAGEQTISIRKIDLDALKLENGSARFSLPGDDTLEIIEAEFPWFSGTIGAYGSKLSIAGGKSEAALQIDNISLGELLKYPNVDGLSGEGVIEGVLPIAFEGGKAFVRNGVLSAKGGGVIRYQNKNAEPAFQANEQTKLAYEVLKEVRFQNLSLVIDGPLDGELQFKIVFDGQGAIPIATRGGTTRVMSPIIYRLTMNVPLLQLAQGAKAAVNPIDFIKSAPKTDEQKNDSVDELIGSNPEIF